MTRDKIKDIFEGVGFAAVIASLVFVGIETRNSAIQAELNTEAVQMAAYQELIQSINDMNALALQVPKLREVSLRMEETDVDFTADEMQVANYWYWMRIRHGDMAYFQFQRGAIDEMRLRSTLAPLIALLKTTHGREEWEWRKRNLAPDFQQYIDDILDEVTASGNRYYAFPNDAN